MFRSVLGSRSRVATAGKEARSVRGGALKRAERDLSVQLSGWMLMEAAHSAAAVSSLA